VLTEEEPPRLIITGPKFVPPPKRVTAYSTVEILLPPEEFHRYQARLTKSETTTEVATPELIDAKRAQEIKHRNYAAVGFSHDKVVAVQDQAKGVLASVAVEEKKLSKFMDEGKSGTEHQVSTTLATLFRKC
jgi:hypothetical protein